MKFKGVFQKYSKEFINEIKKNSPTILTATSIVCMVGAIVTAWRAKDKVDEAVYEKKRANADAIKSEKTEEEIDMVVKENNKKCVKEVAFAMAPTIIFAGLSAGCAIGSQKINNKRLAAVSAAYTLVEKNSEDLKKKFEELYGKGKVDKAKDEVRKDRAREIVDNIDNINVVNTGFGNKYFMDYDSGQVFISDMEHVQKIKNEFNNEILEVCSAYYDVEMAESYELDATDWYSRMGLPIPKWAPFKTWRRGRLMDISWTVSTMLINGVEHEVYVIELLNAYREPKEDKND